jgi:hypothetical protein
LPARKARPGREARPYPGRVRESRLPRKCRIARYSALAGEEWLPQSWISAHGADTKGRLADAWLFQLYSLEKPGAECSAAYAPDGRCNPDAIRP